MRGRPPRDVVLLLAGAAALYVGFWLLVRLRSLLVLLVISLFLAFAIEPAANLLAPRGWRRGLAAAAVFCALALAVVLFVVALGSLLVDQIGALVDAIPGYAQQVLIALLNRPLDAVWVLAFIVVYQQFENMVLSPRITARSRRWSPATCTATR